MDTISVKLRFTYNSNSTIYINSATEITCPSLREIANKSASKSLNKAIASAMEKYINGICVQTIPKKVTLTCNAKGILS